MPERNHTPWGTPERLPVDEDYQVRPHARAAVARRMRLHGFDIIDPRAHTRAAGRYQTSKARRPGIFRHVLELERPLTIPAGTVAALPKLPSRYGGVLGATVSGAGRARVCVGGETVGGPRLAQWRLRFPLLGRLTVAAGARAVRVKSVSLWTYRPDVLEDVDRYAIHRPVRVGGELRVPLMPWRAGALVEQVTVHWGSVEYRHPDTRRPLVEFGYPMYLDGVLGDVYGTFRGKRQTLARGKFIEFDEVENITEFGSCHLDSVSVRLRSRNPRFPPPVCRIAAVEVHYHRWPGIKPARLTPNRWVQPGQPLVVKLPNHGPWTRLDVRWDDRGPAMAALSIGTAKSGYWNVCSRETKTFTYLHGAENNELVFHAREAGYCVRQIAAYGVPDA